MFSALESLNAEVMEAPALEDMMPDEDGSMHDEHLFEAACDIHDDMPDVSDLCEMSDTIEDLEQLHDTIAVHGVSESMMAFTNRDRLLSTVFPAFAAIEALGTSVSADAAEAIAANESLVGKIAEISAAWFEKAWHMVAGLGSKIGSFAKAAFNKVVDASKWVAGKVYDAGKAAADNISAHPVAWIVGTATAAAAVAGVVYGLWSGTLPMDAESYKKWFSESATKLSDAAKHAGEVVSEGAKDAVGHVADAAYTAGSAVKSGTAAALGYTKEGFDRLVEAGKSLFHEGGPISKLGSFFASGAHHIFEAVKSGGAEALKYTRMALSWLIKQTWHIWQRAPATTLKYMTKAFSIFKGLFGHAAKAVSAA